MKIGIAADHAGFEYKEEIKDWLKEKKNKVIDFGTNSLDRCDYPDFAHPLATAIAKEEVNLGIAICGSGNGINMTLNKNEKVRSALCWNVELSELSRLHNDANCLALPSRFISLELAIDCIEKFIETNFEGGRHQRRVEKIS